MSKLVMAIPRSYNKSWIGKQANLCQEISIEDEITTMPKESGYNSVWQMHYIRANATYISDEEAVINSLYVIPKINHMSEINKEYVMDNILEFTKIYIYLTKVNMYSLHLDYTNQALSRLITHNLVNKALHKDYVLPSKLSRKYNPVVDWINNVYEKLITPDAVAPPSR